MSAVEIAGTRSSSISTVKQYAFFGVKKHSFKGKMQLPEGLWSEYKQKLIEGDSVCELVWPSPLQRVPLALTWTFSWIVTCF